MVIKPQFDHAWPFSCGLAMIEVDHKRGYIDKRGNFVISPQFDMAIPFSEGFAFVNAADKKGYVDITGKMISDLQLDEGAESFSEGMAAIEIGKKWGKHAPYTKGNFQFERTVTGWRARYPVLDLRLKR